MTKISRSLGDGGNLHPRENLFIAGNLGSLNAEIVVEADGASCVGLDLRGTFNLTIEVAGTVDGTNWTLIPMRPVNVASIAYVAAITGAVPGLWFGECAGFAKVRARVTAFTSGSASALLLASNGNMPPQLQRFNTPLITTNTGAAAAAVTLTLPAPGAGLRQYLTYLSINRFAAALLTAAATPVLVTTTNLPGTLVFSRPADAAPQGTMDTYREDFAYPLAASAQNTAVTVVAPATTGVIWRLTGGYFIAP
jgi:hypothetical protein